MKTHRLAFVGVGRIADIYYESIRGLSDRAQLVAICDNRSEAVRERADQWQVPGYASFEQLLREVDVDAVCLSLPHHLHAEFVGIAARQRKNVLLEKPIAATREHAEQIVKIVRDSRITLLVGHNGLFHPAFEKMVSFVRQGLLGRPLFARGVSAGWLTFRPWDFRVSQEATGGGCWIDAGGHLVYCLREILGEVAHVTGVTAKLARTEMEGEDHAIGVLRYQSGAIADLFVSYGHKLPGYQYDWPQGYLTSIEIYGDRGAIQYVISPEPRLRYFSEVPQAMPEEWQGWLSHQPAESYLSSFQREIAHFLDCIENEERPRVTAEDALKTLTVLLSLYEQCEKTGTVLPRR